MLYLECAIRYNKFRVGDRDCRRYLCSYWIDDVIKAILFRVEDGMGVGNSRHKRRRR